MHEFLHCGQIQLTQSKEQTVASALTQMPSETAEDLRGESLGSVGPPGILFFNFPSRLLNTFNKVSSASNEMPFSEHSFKEEWELAVAWGGLVPAGVGEQSSGSSPGCHSVPFPSQPCHAPGSLQSISSLLVEFL